MVFVTRPAARFSRCGSVAVNLKQSVNSTTGLLDTGKITEGDTVTVTLGGTRKYTYTVVKDDTLATIMIGIAASD